MSNRKPGKLSNPINFGGRICIPISIAVWIDQRGVQRNGGSLEGGLRRRLSAELLQTENGKQLVLGSGNAHNFTNDSRTHKKAPGPLCTAIETKAMQ